MAKWKKETLKLREGHGWMAKPGHQIFVADRGALRFDIPKEWVVIPGESSFRFHDRTPPEDECALEVTLMYLPPGVNWSAMPLASTLVEVVRGSYEEALGHGECVEVQRPDLELAWVESRYLDTVEMREARARTCIARRGNIQPLITMSYWPSDAERFIPVWDEIIRSMQLGVYVKDPTHRGFN